MRPTTGEPAPYNADRASCPHPDSLGLSGQWRGGGPPDRFRFRPETASHISSNLGHPANQRMVGESSAVGVFSTPASDLISPTVPACGCEKTPLTLPHAAVHKLTKLSCERWPERSV